MFRPRNCDVYVASATAIADDMPKNYAPARRTPGGATVTVFLTSVLSD